METKKFIVHLFDELSLINWLIVILCIVSVSFVPKDEREFIKNVALTALPTGAMMKKNKND